MSKSSEQAVTVPVSAALLETAYEHLRRVAAQMLAREPAGQTLQATALVHEAWLVLQNAPNYPWHNRAEFFSVAAEAMRRILIDRARRKRAVRHGGRLERVEWDETGVAAPGDDDEVMAVHEALDGLAVQEPKKAELVKLRYFAGLTLEEAAEVLGVSHPTAKRYWAYARAWLYREILHERNGGASTGAARAEPQPGS